MARIRVGTLCGVLMLAGSTAAAAQEAVGLLQPRSWRSPILPLMAPITPVRPSPSLDRRVSLDGSVYVGAAEIDPSGRDRGTPAFGLFAQGQIHHDTRLTLSVAHGPVGLASLIMLAPRLGTTARADIMHPKWRLVAGDFTSVADALTGYYVQADGVTFRSTGLVSADVQIGRPKYWGGGAGGYLATARVGVRTPQATLRIVGSSLQQPPPSNIRIRLVANPEVETERDLADVQRLQSVLPPSNTLNAIGLEGEWRPASGHELAARAGILDTSGPGMQGVGRARGVSGEVRYSLTQARGSLVLQARRAPGGVLGFPLAGEAVNASGSTGVGGGFKAIASAYWTTTPLPGRANVRARGGSAGLDFTRKRTRLRLQARHLELETGSFTRTRRTVALGATLPWRVVRVTGDAELGTARQRDRDEPYRFLRGRLGLFEDGALALGVGGAYEDTGVGPPRVRGDADLSFSRGELMFDLGAGVSTGDLLGTARHLWIGVDAPIGGGLVLTTSIDAITWDYSSSSYLAISEAIARESPWRFSIGVRRSLSIKLPFLRVERRDSRGPTP